MTAPYLQGSTCSVASSLGRRRAPITAPDRRSPPGDEVVVLDKAEYIQKVESSSWPSSVCGTRTSARRTSCASTNKAIAGPRGGTGDALVCRSAQEQELRNG